jgi:hypothetical protein
VIVRISHTRQAVDGVGVLRGLDVRGDLLVNGRVDVVVDEEDIEARLVGASSG